MKLKVAMLVLISVLVACSKSNDTSTSGGPSGNGGQSTGAGTFTSIGSVPVSDTGHYTTGCVQPGSSSPDLSRFDDRLQAGMSYEQNFEFQAVDGRAAFLQSRTTITQIVSPQVYEATTTITSFRGDTFGLTVQVGQSYPRRCSITVSSGNTVMSCVSLDGSVPPSLDQLTCNIANITQSTDLPREIGTYLMTGGRRFAAHLERSSLSGDITCAGQTWSGSVASEFYKTNELPSQSNYRCGGEAFRADIQYLDGSGAIRSRLKFELTQFSR